MNIHIGWNPQAKRWEYFDMQYVGGSTATPDPLHGTEAPAPALTSGTVHFEQDPQAWRDEQASTPWSRKEG
jgi:hypothetical protein